ncbi:MAG: hypothetical protein ACK4UJ_01340 [Leptonema sp. (in: bacteria)]
MKPKTKNSKLIEEKFYNSKEWEEDPMVLKKQGLDYLRRKDISYYKKKIIDENYMEHAIQRIAMELSHFIIKEK